MKITVDVPETCPHHVGKDPNETVCVECPFFVSGEIRCQCPEDKELVTAVRRALSLDKGKIVLVTFGGDNDVRSGYECQDKDTNVCNECLLRFTCYTNQYLTIEAKDLDLRLDQPLDETVEDYIERAKPKRKETNS